MRKIKLMIMLIVLTIAVCSCIGSNKILSTTGTQTQVILSENNYRVIQKLEGTATSRSFLGIGHLQSTVITTARNNMLANVNFIGNSKSVINEYIEVYNRWNLIIPLHRITVTASAYLIEFTNKDGKITDYSQNSVQSTTATQSTTVQQIQPMTSNQDTMIGGFPIMVELREFTAMFEAPNTSSKQLLYIPGGAIVKLIGEERNFYNVEFNEKKGFVRKSAFPKRQIEIARKLNR